MLAFNVAGLLHIICSSHIAISIDLLIVSRSISQEKTSVDITFLIIFCTLALLLSFFPLELLNARWQRFDHNFMRRNSDFTVKGNAPNTNTFNFRACSLSRNYFYRNVNRKCVVGETSAYEQRQRSLRVGHRKSWSSFLNDEILSSIMQRIRLQKRSCCWSGAAQTQVIVLKHRCA